MLVGARNAILAGGAKLPYDKQVEYLQSNGNQYINTGVYPTNSLTVEVRAYRTASTTADEVLFGSRMYNSYCDVTIWTNPLQGSKGIAAHFAYGTNGMTVEDSGWVYKGNILNEWITTLVTPQEIKVNGQSVYSWKNSRTPYTSTRAAYLFAMYSDIAVDTRKFIGRVSKCAISNNGVLVRDFIPVRFTNENGVTEGAMFDRANPTVGMNPDGSARDDGLYRNRGTGAFVIGPDASAANGGGV